MQSRSSSARLGDEPLFAHPLGEQPLPERVVELVRTGVEQILALEINARGHAQRGRDAICAKQRRGPAGVIAEQAGERGPVGGIGAGFAKRVFQLVERRDQRLGHEAAAELSEAAAGVGERAGIGGEQLGRLSQHRCSFKVFRSSIYFEASKDSKRDKHQPRVSSTAAARAARTKARTFARSLKPSGPSMPEETSTPSGRAMRIASATLPGFKPPARSSLPA